MFFKRRRKGGIFTPTNERIVIPCAGFEMIDDIIIEAVTNGSSGGSSGGTDTSDATVTSADLAEGVIAYGAEGRVVGSLPVNGASDITISSSGLVRVAKGIFKSLTSKQLSIKPGSTITPTETEQVAVASGLYTTGDVKISAIPSDYVGSGVERVESSYVDATKNGTTLNLTGKYCEGDITIGGYGDRKQFNYVGQMTIEKNGDPMRVIPVSIGYYSRDVYFKIRSVTNGSGFGNPIVVSEDRHYVLGYTYTNGSTVMTDGKLSIEPTLNGDITVTSHNPEHQIVFEYGYFE